MHAGTAHKGKSMYLAEVETNLVLGNAGGAMGKLIKLIDDLLFLL
jgi:hypothetical protein